MPLPSDDEIIAAAIDRALELGEPACRYIDAALDLAGLSYAAGGATRDAYVQKLYLERLHREPTAAERSSAYAMAAAQSTCGITTECIWDRAGVDAAWLREPYGARVNRGFYAVMAEYEFAKQVGAWVSALPWVAGTALPDLGDAVIIGDNTDGMRRGSSTKVQHELTMLCYLNGPAGPGSWACSIDGGQPGVAYRTRQWVEVPGELWAGAVDPSSGVAPLGYDGRPLNGRRVIGYVDAKKLPYRADAPPCAGGGGRILGIGLPTLDTTLKFGAALLGGLTVASLAGVPLPRYADPVSAVRRYL